MLRYLIGMASALTVSVLSDILIGIDIREAER